MSIYLHLYNCHVHYVESQHFLLMENTTHLSTCPIIMGVESYLSEYIGTRGCLDDWNIWKMAEVVHYPNYALTSCAVLVVSSITIDMLR